MGVAVGNGPPPIQVAAKVLDESANWDYRLNSFIHMDQHMPFGHPQCESSFCGQRDLNLPVSLQIL